MEMRIRLFLLHIRRSARIFLHAWKVLFVGDRLPFEIEPRPLPEITHPSQLCKCPEGIDGPHLTDCPWLAAMCKTCIGTGYCTRCHGDACEPTEEASAP